MARPMMTMKGKLKLKWFFPCAYRQSINSLFENCSLNRGRRGSRSGDSEDDDDDDDDRSDDDIRSDGKSWLISFNLKISWIGIGHDTVLLIPFESWTVFIETHIAGDNLSPFTRICSFFFYILMQSKWRSFAKCAVLCRFLLKKKTKTKTHISMFNLSMSKVWTFYSLDVCIFSERKNKKKKNRKKKQKHKQAKHNDAFLSQWNEMLQTVKQVEFVKLSSFIYILNKNSSLPFVVNFGIRLCSNCTPHRTHNAENILYFSKRIYKYNIKIIIR